VWRFSSSCAIAGMCRVRCPAMAAAWTRPKRAARERAENVLRAACALLVGWLLTGHAVARAQLSTIAGGARVDGVQIVVGGLAPGPSVIMILQSDVELRARLSLLRGAGEDAALGPLPQDLLRATQQELLGEALIASEAARLALATPTRRALERERQRFVMGSGGRTVLMSLLEKLGVTPRELDEIVARRVVVSEFLEANLAGTSELSATELRRAYDSAEHPFADRPFAEVRDALRGYLAQRALEQAVGRWVDGLKQRVPHRVIVAY